MKDEVNSAASGSDNTAAALENALANKTLGVSATRYYCPEPRLGFTPYAELWHGRLAMVGFVVALLFEVISSHLL